GEGRRRGRADERVQVLALDVVEPERAGERVEHRRRGGQVAALLEADGVVDAHACERGDLLAPQTPHPPLPAGLDTDVLGPQPRAADAQELAKLALPGHASSVWRAGGQPWVGRRVLGSVDLLLWSSPRGLMVAMNITPSHDHIAIRVVDYGGTLRWY